MACSQDGGGAGKRACSCQEVCVYLLEGMGEREEHKSLMEGPSSGAHVAIGYAWAHGVMLFHTDPTPFAWGIEKRFRVVVWTPGGGVGVASIPEGLLVVLTCRKTLRQGGACSAF